MACDYSNAVTRSNLGNGNIRYRTGYDGGQGVHSDPGSYKFAQGFYQDADTWAALFDASVQSQRSSNWSLKWSGHVGIYGHCDDSGYSAHKVGRAFDLTRVQFDNGEFIDTNWSWRQGELHKRRYLAVAVHLRRSFKVVLTHHYPNHDDHIHFDNGEDMKPILDTSKVDTQLIQMACNLQINTDLSVDGDWGPRTEDAFDSLKRRMGLGCYSPRENISHMRTFMYCIFADAINNNGATNSGLCS